MVDIEQLIDAADKRAALYDGDDRQDIKTDVINAFYAGAEFGELKALGETGQLREQLDKWRKGQNTITRSHYLEEIERLRAEIENARRAIGQLYRERDEAYERAAQVCDYLTGRSQEFDMGRLHCAQAVRALKSTAPTNETGNATDFNALSHLLYIYWEAAYAEGKEGRNRDTRDAVAQRTLEAIHAEVQRLIGRADETGNARMGGD